MKPTLVILAAGMGSRYGGLKQVDKLGPGGETIIDYSVFDAMRAGFGKVVFVIRKSIEQDFVEVFANRFLKKVPHEVVFQEIDLLPQGFTCPEGRTKPWGTVHALWVTRNVVKEPFVVINADDFYGGEAYQTLAKFHSQGLPDTSGNYAMCGYLLENTLSEHGSVTRGVCMVSPDGYLESVDEQYNIEKTSDGTIVSHKPEGDITLDPGTLVSMNIWAFNPSIFPILESRLRDFLSAHIDEPKSEYVTPRMVDELIKENKINVKMLQSSARWFGVTYAEDKKTVFDNLTALYQNNQYPPRLWE